LFFNLKLYVLAVASAVKHAFEMYFQKKTNRIVVARRAKKIKMVFFALA